MAHIVLKLGGNVVLDPEQIRLVAQELRGVLDAGHGATLVHGGGPQLDKAIAELGEKTVKIDGLRVTSVAAAAVVLRVMNEIGDALALQLRAHGIPARHVVATASGMHATQKRIAGGDLGRVGTVTRFDATPLNDVVEVVTPVGFDGAGPLNVNADEGACAVAAAFQASWLILGTDVAAVRDGSGADLMRLTPKTARQLLGGAATGGMIPKLTSALAALESGVGKVLITRIQPGTVTGAILHGRADGTLVEKDLVNA